MPRQKDIGNLDLLDLVEGPRKGPERAITESAASSFAFVIDGPPRTKKTSNRILRIGHFNKVMPSKAFLEWQDLYALPQLGRQMAGRAPLTSAVHVQAMFFRDALRGDLVGYMTALADVLQDGGVIADDKQIVSWDGTRMTKDKKRPRVELVVEVLGDAEEEEA